MRSYLGAPMNRFPPNFGCGGISSFSTGLWYSKSWNAKKVFCDIITSVLYSALSYDISQRVVEIDLLSLHSIFLMVRSLSSTSVVRFNAWMQHCVCCSPHCLCSYFTSIMIGWFTFWCHAKELFWLAELKLKSYVGKKREIPRGQE